MFRHAGMANAVTCHECVIDVGVLRMDVKNTRPEAAHIRHGIDELTHEMTGVPFDAEVLAFALAEEALPHGRLREHVVTHDRQVIRPHWTMFKCDANAFAFGLPGNGLPKLN